jgi:3-hydroxyisobutyrate dehydrogenase
MKIGIAGIGKMGQAIGGRLLGLGHTLHVWNRTEVRAQPLLSAGALWAANPQALAEQVDVVISLLTNEDAIESVYFGEHGLTRGPVAGKVFVEMSTVKPAKQQEMAPRVEALGAGYLECPVSGSVGPAKEGKLIGFVGGNAATLDKVHALLSQICRRVEPVGMHGAGAMMKLAVNLPLMVYWQTLSEALSLIEPLGVDPQRVVDILSDSSGGPNMLKVRGGMIAQALAGEKNDMVTVNLATMRKDVKTMLAQGTSLQRAMPLTTLALESFERAASDGMDAADCSHYPVWWLQHGSKP